MVVPFPLNVITVPPLALIFNGIEASLPCAEIVGLAPVAPPVT